MEMPTSKTVTTIMIVVALLLIDLLPWVTPLSPEKYNVENKIYKAVSSLNILP